MFILVAMTMLAVLMEMMAAPIAMVIMKPRKAVSNMLPMVEIKVMMVTMTSMTAHGNKSKVVQTVS